jgi:alkanesulfonate monooxygenase SsuD/methylene tetrahydromethanopterin reductase-like flavin-dependent oxidoreductase (luciferase family)
MTRSGVGAASGSRAEGTPTGGVPPRLGRLGVWMSSSSPVPPELAAEAERLGYGAVWLGNADGNLVLAEQLLTATSTLIVATGIVSIWVTSERPAWAAMNRPLSTHRCGYGA